MTTYEFYPDSITVHDCGETEAYPARYYVTKNQTVTVYIEMYDESADTVKEDRIYIDKADPQYMEAFAMATDPASDKKTWLARAPRKAKESKPIDPAKDWAGSNIVGRGWTIEFDAKLQKTRVIFDRFPKEAAKEAVKAAGFFWNACTQSWNKGLTCKAHRAALQLSTELATIYNR